MKESDIQRQILDYLRLNGYFAVKISNSGIYRKSTDSWIPSTMRGISDIYFIGHGKQGWIEVKMPKGIVSEFQKEFISNIVSHGGMAFVARSVEDVVKKLSTC